MAEQWPREKIFSLIKSFRRNECLWKASNKHYLDRKARDNALNEIAETVGCDVRSVERKIKTLRTQFLNYYKEACKKCSGSDADEAYKPKWFAYESLKFLLHRSQKPICKKKITSSTDVENEAGDYLRFIEHETEDESRVEEPAEESQSHRSINGLMNTHKSVSKPQQIQKKRKSDASNEGPLINGSYGSSDTVAENTRRDEFTVFGEHVAYRLRSISDTQARLVAQYRINNILFEAEIAKYQQSSTVQQPSTSSISSRSPSPSINPPIFLCQKVEKPDILIE